jgi:protein ImuA
MYTKTQVQQEPDAVSIERLRGTIARIERRGGYACPNSACLSFGIETIDRHLPGGGLSVGLHELAGCGADREHATVPALLAACLLAHGRDRHAPVLWATERRDLFAPGLLAAGLDPDRLIVAEAPGEVLAAMEEAARVPGLAGVVGELSGKLGLTASRRLQLAAEAAGVPVLVVRRPRHAGVSIEAPNAATTRWRVGCVPSEPVDAIETGPFSLTVGRARWRLDLVRARGAEPASWIVEAFDEKGGLALPAHSAHRSVAPAGQAAGWAVGDLAA